MSSKSNSPSFGAQVFDLNTGTFSIKQVPVSQTVFPCKRVSELTPIQISRLKKAYYKVGYVLNANLARPAPRVAPATSAILSFNGCMTNLQ